MRNGQNKVRMHKKSKVLGFLQLFSLHVGRSQGEPAGWWRGPVGVLENAEWWKPGPAAEKQIKRKMDRQEEVLWDI